METSNNISRDKLITDKRNLSWLWLAIALLVFFSHVRGIGPFIVDDSYITFRYARNLSNGYGLVFNPGGPHTEGFTSPLWMLIMTIPFLLHLSPELFARYSGIFFTLLTMGFSFLIIRRLLPESIRDKYHWITGGMVLSLAITPATTVHAISGMETALYTFLVTLYFYRLIIYMEKPSRSKALFLALSGFMVGLTRPEGNLIPILSMGIALFFLSKKEISELIKMAFVGYILPGIIYFAIRYAYFGLIFPLPYYVKLGNYLHICGSLSMILNLSSFFLSGGFMIVFSANKLAKRLLPLWISVLGFIIFFFFPMHVMGYNMRFMYPVLPMLLCMVYMGCYSMAEGFINQFSINNKPLISNWINIGIALVPAVLLMATYPEIHHEKVEEYKGMLNAHIQLGKDLEAYKCNPRQMHIAMGDAGAVPYFSDWNTLDFIGLNNIDMATTRNEQIKAKEALSTEPELLVLVSNSYKKFCSPVQIDNVVYTEMMKKANYKLVRIYQFQADYHYLWVMAKPGSPMYRYFVESINKRTSQK